MRYAADMGLAQQAMNDGHFVEMKKRLVRHQPGLEDDDLRHFEWYHLWQLAGAQSRPLGGHADAVTAIACSPAAGSLATGGKEGRVRLWNIKTRADSWELGVTSGQVHCLAFRPMAGRWRGEVKTASWSGMTREVDPLVLLAGATA